MATEIERKFLVIGDTWRAQVRDARPIRQAYVAIGDRATVRVRITDGSTAKLTIKSASAGHTRSEFEYPIPVEDAEAMLGLRTGAVVSKLRHHVPAGPLMWEIDVFDGENSGLVIAEIELSVPDQSFERPPWLGREVTDDRRYFNADLALWPFTRWPPARGQ